MAWIQLPIAPELGREFPGILGPMTFRPETAAPMNELVNILLRGESTLTSGERELIATHVSWRNDCFFCQTIHGAVAAAQLNHNEELVQKVKTDWVNSEISPKLKALLNIAGKVQQGGKCVTEDDISAARREGATDREIHDTVLIAAVFCMCNRYVDGLGTWAPQDPDIYRARGADCGARLLCRHSASHESGIALEQKMCDARHLRGSGCRRSLHRGETEAAIHINHSHGETEIKNRLRQGQMPSKLWSSSRHAQAPGIMPDQSKHFFNFFHR